MAKDIPSIHGKGNCWTTWDIEGNKDGRNGCRSNLFLSDVIIKRWRVKGILNKWGHENGYKNHEYHLYYLI